MDELARARRRPARVVGALDQRDRVAARGGVERDARTRDPAPDDEDVVRVGLQGPDGVRLRLVASRADGPGIEARVVETGRLVLGEPVTLS